jgi:nanoRNase/pAp phosphatase (c-di-AMP/oligoRNAs hydrolase)
MIIASLRSRNGEAIKVAEKLQGGGHANASGATLPKSVRTIDDAVEYLRTVLNPPKPAAINTLESLFSGLEPKR